VEEVPTDSAQSCQHEKCASSSLSYAARLLSDDDLLVARIVWRWLGSTAPQVLPRLPSFALKISMRLVIRAHDVIGPYRKHPCQESEIDYHHVIEDILLQLLMIDLKS
jgi:hypothetical protein